VARPWRTAFNDLFDHFIGRPDCKAAVRKQAGQKQFASGVLGIGMR